jgi:hypothetical protein
MHREIRTAYKTMTKEINGIAILKCTSEKEVVRM